MPYENRRIVGRAAKDVVVLENQRHERSFLDFQGRAVYVVARVDSKVRNHDRARHAGVEAELARIVPPGDDIALRFGEELDVTGRSVVLPSVAGLRLAAHELMLGETPRSVVINEAVELANQYSTDKAGGFVNGVLGNLGRALDEDESPRDEA